MKIFLWYTRFWWRSCRNWQWESSLYCNRAVCWIQLNAGLVSEKVMYALLVYSEKIITQPAVTLNWQNQLMCSADILICLKQRSPCSPLVKFSFYCSHPLHSSLSSISTLSLPIFSESPSLIGACWFVTPCQCKIVILWS